MPLVPLQKKRLDAISDATVGAVENYPGEPLDVIHVLLCVAVETMAQENIDPDLMRQLFSLVIDEGGD